MGQITEDFIQRAMRCCQLGQHPSMTVWETRQLLTAWVEWQGCRDERDKLDEANRICEQWRQWTVATRAENEALRARVAEYGERISALTALCTRAVVEGWTETQVAAELARLSGNKPGTPK